MLQSIITIKEQMNQLEREYPTLNEKLEKILEIPYNKIKEIEDKKP